MQTFTVLVALSSVLIFEGGRRLLTSFKDRSGYGFAIAGLTSLSLAAWMHISEDMAYKVMAPPETGTRFTAAPPWSNPKEALPGLPISEQAEKTRIVAKAYYTETGKLIEHMSTDGVPVKFAPTQEEIKVREDWIAWRISSEAHLSHTYGKPTHLLAVIGVAALAAFALRRRHAKSAA